MVKVTADMIELDISPPEGADVVFMEFIEMVATQAPLMRFKTILQYGNKQGESLYMHIMNMIGVLETLRSSLHMEEMEARVLYSAVVIHDVNKFLEEKKSFSKLAVPETLAEQIQAFNLDAFLPEWESYLQDITTLVRIHSGHTHVAAEGWNFKRAEQYGLGQARVQALGHLIRAVDVIDLSHGIQERKHKTDFLGHLNAYCADTGIQQYELHTHQLVEQRGQISNIIHNAVMKLLSENGAWLPVLLYPDGVVYLGAKHASDLPVTDQLVERLGKAVAGRIKQITADVGGLVKQTAQGVKVKPDVFGLNLSMETIWNYVRNLNWNPKTLLANAEAATAELTGYTQESVTPATIAQMRSAELVRAYYIFLNDHFAKSHFKNDKALIWQHLYELLELHEDRFVLYEQFEERYKRAYVLAADLWLSEEEIYERIVADSQEMTQTMQAVDTDQNIWSDYLRLYLLIDGLPVATVDWQAHVQHYIDYQHQQCVYCSSPFDTNLWESGYVRKDLKVEKFSNRLLGGGSKEPKKYVCAICQTQFFIEALNYPNLRGENVFYLHLFPYSYLTAPFLQGLKATLQRLKGTDFAIQVLNMDVRDAVDQIVDRRTVVPQFRFQTKEGKPQPFGVYVPEYLETLAGVIIMPLNPGGDNDTEQFLFTLWNALVLQRYWGLKVLMSKSPVPPLNDKDIPDVFLDMIPLACEGLLPESGYAQFTDNQHANLPKLWDQVARLFRLRQALFSMNDDPLPELVRAMAGGALQVFFIADRLIEKKDLDYKVTVYQNTFPDVEYLANSIGGVFMEKLSDYLQAAAALAWSKRIRGSSLKRSSLLHPVQEVFTKLALSGGAADRDTLLAATVQDIFLHLERTADEGFKPGANKLGAIEQFVRIWYEDILDHVYQGHLQKLLNDEKLLRSAYLFYIQAQIPNKSNRQQESEEE